jgi:hypothetical protein
MKALTVKMQTVTLIGKGRYDLTCFVYSVCEINSKRLFLGTFFWGGVVILDLDKYILPWQRWFLGGGSYI